MESEGMFMSFHIISLKNDYMANPKFKNAYLPPLHDDETLLSRMTVFEERGDDVGWPTVITMLSASRTNDTSRYHSKLNLFLYACLQISPVNGILLYALSYINSMFTSMSTNVTGARDSSHNRESWMRRRSKIQEKLHRSI
jgi:hypothetical protein